MSSPMVRRETVRDIEAICRLDLDSRILRRRIADRLTRLIPADSYCFSTIDPMTLLTADQVSTGLVPEAAAAAAHNEYLVDDVLKFAALARFEVSAGTLGAATGGDPESSHRYRTVLPMIDARHELRAGFVVDGRCWGVVALFRGGRRPDFTPADVGVLRRLSAPVGAALRRTAHRAPDGTAAGPSEAGVLLLDQDLRLFSENPAAKLWRDELSPSQAELPSAILEVAARGKGAELPAYGRIRGRSGRWLSVQASPLSGGPHPAAIAVTVHPTPAADVAEILLLAYGLTPRERDVLARVVAGLPSRTIAVELHITAATVQDHLKSVFAKTGVRSRSELVATVLGL
ncbi:helix-turn-helix transcriptional regulator [Streptomyces olivaceus]|uniref:helix-turn-helix transcriptional regulator n=1 Tax=Streptomyces olivaceus TaxID=47716 RepID=UPI001CCA4A7A|nr:helix-turn-helix transcriptional regulator [Streptomyces olivaceus]MBZ6205986.1 helix-turn-helix transcriptional regulator [Streptomyces olivaceus]